MERQDLQQIDQRCLDPIRNVLAKALAIGMSRILGMQHPGPDLLMYRGRWSHDADLGS